ncbi:MAG: M48 family metallopeptidase [Planctomycetota bacterium]
MVPFAIIVLAASVALLDNGVLASQRTLFGPVIALGGPIVIVACLHGVLTILGSWLDRRGHRAAVIWADRAVTASVVLITVGHVGAMMLGWMHAVRALAGDLVLVDEAVVLAPALVGIAACWGAYYSIDRRLREGVMVTRLDRGDPVPDFPSVGGYVVDRLRHQVLIVLVPIGLVAGWAEVIERVAPDWGWLEPLGVVVVVALTPWVLVRVWRTEPLGDGPLRRSLLDMCRTHRVRVADLRIWRAHDHMINGALLGLVPRLRYILLTDALIETLPDAEMRAVMAHEIGHARRRHIPWLVASMIGILISVTVAIAWPAQALLIHEFGAVPEAGEQWGAIVGLLVAGGVAFVCFGYISRRFEWQADAFALQHLSLGQPVITAGAGVAMAGALGTVAACSGLRVERFNFRHGSIADRQRRIAAAVGLPASALPADRTVGRVKALIAATVVLAAILFVATWAASPTPSPDLPSP